MRNVMRLTGIVLAIALVFSLDSCKKYEDGPLLSFRSKQERVVNSWKLEKYLNNDIDKTAELTVTNYKEFYNADGSCKRTFNDSSGDFVDQPGTWAFNSDKTEININGIGSVELSQSLGTVSASAIKILRLKEKEFWYSFENGGSRHEFHLIPQ